MSLVLAIEPDSRQAAILKRVIREKVRADFVHVDSRDAAMAAIRARIPDVILVTALMSPRDEEELITFSAIARGRRARADAYDSAAGGKRRRHRRNERIQNIRISAEERADRHLSYRGATPICSRVRSVTSLRAPASTRRNTRRRRERRLRILAPARGANAASTGAPEQPNRARILPSGPRLRLVLTVRVAKERSPDASTPSGHEAPRPHSPCLSSPKCHSP